MAVQPWHRCCHGSRGRSSISHGSNEATVVRQRTECLGAAVGLMELATVRNPISISNIQYINIHQYSSIFINIHQYSSIVINIHQCQYPSITINNHQYQNLQFVDVHPGQPLFVQHQNLHQ
jgi:hypothetical protein